MTDGLKASQIKGGIRPSKSFDRAEYAKMNLAALNLVFTTKEIIASITLQ